MNKKILFALGIIALLVTGCSGNTKGEVTYFENVLVDYAHLLDPAMIHGDDGRFYAYVTEGNQKWRGEGTESFDSKTPIFVSDDMVNWTYETDVVAPNQANSWKWAGALSFWSPEIAKIGDKYVFYYSLGRMGGGSQDGVGCAYSSSPTGPWTWVEDPIIIGEDVDNVDPIDPCIVVDNGHVYMFYGDYDGIEVVELNATGTAIKKGATPTIVAGEVNGVQDWNNYTAPYVKKINNKWCLFVSTGEWNSISESTTNIYRTVVFQSESLTSGYKDSQNRTALEYGHGDLVVASNDEFTGPGNVSVIQDDEGSYYMYFHTYIGFDIAGGRFLGLEKLDISGAFPTVKDQVVHKNVEAPVIYE